MELWEKIIIEWIECVNVKQEESVKNTTELQNGAFYIDFLNLIKWENLKDCNQENVIVKFLEAEYPSFKVNKDDGTEHIYIASLLLVHACQMRSAIDHSLKYNMCDNLKHETQIRVKTFLESLLPLGRNITKETMKEVIMEVEDISTISNIRRTPIGRLPKSPATCSARSRKIMTDRIRELRNLRCNLEEEQFNNAELQHDIKIQQEKIEKLQQKLNEKSAEVKALKEERMKPGTPQPLRRKEDGSQENYYKKYISDLESQLDKQQDEINTLETDKDILSKKLSCMERAYIRDKENFANCEQSLESLSSKIEVKDRELVELRMQNEELRVRIKELDKNFEIEQSFEVEDLPQLPATPSLNISEALSSVIEIQLQEAKEESAIWQAEADTLKGKLSILTKDYKTVMESNRNLQEKVKILDRVQIELNNVQKELEISNTDIVNLQAEKTSLIAQNGDLENLLSSKEKELSEVKQSNTALNTELTNSKIDIKNLNELFEEEKANSSNLSTDLMQTKLQITEHLAHIQKLTDEKDSFKSFIENCSENLKDILHCNNQFVQVETDNLDNLTLNDLIKYTDTMLHNCNAAMRNP